MRSIAPRTIAADVNVRLFAVATVLLFLLSAGCTQPRPTTRPTLAGPPRYRVIQIPAIQPSYQSFGLAIADKNGNVAGDSGFKAAFWRRGSTVRANVVHDHGDARAINVDGDVAGSANFGNKTHAFVSRRGRPAQDVGTLPHDIRSHFNGIAQHSFFPVGVSDGPRGSTAVILQNGQLHPLPKLAANATSQAYGVNDTHIVCGEALVGSVGTACTWRMIGGQFAIQALTTPAPWSSARANAIANDRTVVGVAASVQGWQAYLWDPNGTPRRLGTPPPGDSSEASDVANVDNPWHNDLQAVGYLRSPNDAYRAAIWLNGQQHELNRLIPAGSGWELQIATAINDKGEITGFGTFNGLDSQGFILVPVSPFGQP